MREKILVFAPHPDDEILGCGGTILKSLAKGDEVTVCVVSVRNVPLFTEEMHNAQYSELANAHKALNVSKSIVLDFDSVTLDTVPHYELNRAIERVVKEVKPDTVYMPFVGDIHLDHKLVADSVLVACRPFGETIVKKIYMYETLSETGWNYPTQENAFIPTVYNDITDYIEKKVEIMKLYKDQQKEYPHPRSIERIVDLAATRGGNVSFKFAESFMVVREICK